MMSKDMEQGYNNSTDCPDCGEKIYFTRKRRLFFHWVEVLDRKTDMVHEIMCKFCNSRFNRWNGSYIGKMESPTVIRKLLNENL